MNELEKLPEVEVTVIKHNNHKIGVKMVPIKNDQEQVTLETEAFLANFYRDFTNRGGHFEFGVNEQGNWAVIDYRGQLMVSQPLTEAEQSVITQTFESEDARINLLLIERKTPEKGYVFWTNLSVALQNELIKEEVASEMAA